MRLILHLESAGEQRPVTGDRFTIGRAQENDWVLPDPEQHLSRQHCVIERRGDGFCVVDTSANGVFVNGESVAARPRSRARPRPWRPAAARLVVIAVAIEGAAAPAPAAERGKMFDPTHVPKAAAKEGAGRVFDHTWVGSREALGPADHRASATARSPDPRFQTPPEHRPGRSRQDRAGAGRSVRHASSRPLRTAPSAPDACRAAAAAPVRFRRRRAKRRSRSTADGRAADAARRSLRRAAATGRRRGARLRDPPGTVASPPAPGCAASATAQPLPPNLRRAGRIAARRAPAPARSRRGAGGPGHAPDRGVSRPAPGSMPHAVSIDDPEAFMRAAGARLRELTEGLVQLLNARASVKNVARVERTTIGRDHNNPLKYSVDAAGGAARGPDRRAGPASCRPRRRCAAAFATSRSTRWRSWTRCRWRCAPCCSASSRTSFERQLEAENLFSTLVGGGRRAKCWDAFKARYEQIASEAEREFLGEVGADFSRGYEARTRRM